MAISPDGGENWIELNDVGQRALNAQVSVPSVTTDNAIFSLTRGNQTIFSEPFSISPVARNFEILEVCGNDMLFSWDPVEDAVSYDVYALGDKYMEYAETTTDTFIRMPIKNPFEINWFALSTNFENGTQGVRSIALNNVCLLYTSPSPRDQRGSRMPSSA